MRLPFPNHPEPPSVAGEPWDSFPAARELVEYDKNGNDNDEDEERDDSGNAASDHLIKTQAWSLYLSHFLSTWNSRTYEYSAIVFIQSAFPGTLLPSSLHGIAETICVLLFSPALGRWVDAAPSRLRPLLVTNLANRVALGSCCMVWPLLFAAHSEGWRRFLFGVLLVLGMVEKISRMTNTLCMERDWIPVLANSTAAVVGEDSRRAEFDLTHLNTVMRRIDITCKLAASLVISSFLARAGPSLAAMAIGVVGIVSMLIEMWGAIRVWNRNRKLWVPKQAVQGPKGWLELEPRTPSPRLYTFPLNLGLSRSFRMEASPLVKAARRFLQAQLSGFHYYFTSSVCLPSVCAGILHGSVLAWSGTLITWLLNAGFPVGQVTVANGVGSVFELASTIVFPLGVNFLSRQDGHKGAKSSYRAVNRHRTNSESSSSTSDDSPLKLSSNPSQTLTPSHSKLDTSVIKLARYAITLLLVTLIPTIIALFRLPPTITTTITTDSALNPATPPHTSTTTNTTAALTFFTFLSLSLLGRWTYDLAVLQLEQTLIPASHRSGFGGAEQAVMGLGSLLHWVAAAVWHAQDDFKWLALGSVLAVAVAAGGYVWWSSRLEPGAGRGGSSSG